MSTPLQRNVQPTPSSSVCRPNNNNAWRPSAALELKRNALRLRQKRSSIVQKRTDNVWKRNGNVPKLWLRLSRLLVNGKPRRLKSSEPNRPQNKPDKKTCASVSSS